MAETAGAGVRNNIKKPKQYLCGTPLDDCTGATGRLSKSISQGTKRHSSSDEAFKCYKRHLLKQGYIQRGSREFENPTTHYITVLTKKSKFGARLRGRKGTNYGPGDRMGGTIIC